MKKLASLVAALLLAVSALPAEAAFVVGGENGWQLSTDGIVDVFSFYQSTSPIPAGDRSFSLIGDTTSYDQRFGVRVGLLPSVVAFNVKAPTVNGVDSSVRIGIYPNIQNNSDNRFDTSPNIDFREIFYTAKGAYGELLAGRALNLYQGKNILTDMTLLTAGVVGSPLLRGGTTLGHIGYGYLYTNFGPQIRYTTPDLGGVKVAVSVNEPYKISADTAKTATPRVETEISYATVFGGGNTLQAWVSALYQSATRSATAAARPGQTNESIGGAGGVGVGFGGVDLLASGYLGQGLGMVSAQDGDFLGTSSTDGAGEERTHWGFLAQATYKLTPTVKLGVNYGQSRQERTDADKADTTGFALMKKQEAAVAMVTYNFNKFTQFIAEYSYAQNTWHDNATQHTNSIALGTMFYW
jgi:predicted porin